jgi:muconolactone delta-isomerase
MQYLVIMRLKPGTRADQLAPLAKPEAAKAWEMLAAGRLRSIHFIEGPVGAVLMFEAADQKEVETHVNQLPLVGAGLVTVEVLPLTPFTGFAALFAPSPG